MSLWHSRHARCAEPGRRLGRLTSWSGQIHGPESWAYDGNGNIISNTEFISDQIRTTAFTYSTTISNQLSQQQTAGLGVEAYTYDQHGDTKSITSTDPALYPNGQVDPYHVNIHVTYDAQERPITVTTLMDGAPITATLGYNAQGQRDRYTVVSGTATLRDERFSYRGDELGQDVVVSGTQTYTDTFIYDQSASPLELIRQQNGTTSRYWYVLDGQGNVVALVDSSGNVVDRYAYDPWGEGLPEGTVETVRQPLRYGGYWWDAEVGWYWVHSRYYDPEGRWLQPDKSEIDGVRTYVYVNDDPIDFSDPLGLGAYPQPCFLVSPTKTMCETGTSQSYYNGCTAKFRDFLDCASMAATVGGMILVFVPGGLPFALALEVIATSANGLGTAMDAKELLTDQRARQDPHKILGFVFDLGSLAFSRVGGKIIDYAVSEEYKTAWLVAKQRGAPQAEIDAAKSLLEHKELLAKKIEAAVVEPKAVAFDWANHCQASEGENPQVPCCPPVCSNLAANNEAVRPGNITVQTRPTPSLPPLISGRMFVILVGTMRRGKR